MGSPWNLIVLVICCIQFVGICGVTDSNDFAALNGLKSSWNNFPPNWKGQDPCGSSWGGISCNASRVTSIMLGGMGISGGSLGDITSLIELQYLDLSNNVGLKGTLPSSIGNLQNLSVLILIGCGFFGPIPESLGSLPKLVYLSLNSNSFSGPIPPSIGKLAKLSWLDLSDNQLNGTIPVSNGASPGLDMLLKAKHFHLSKNQFSGSIQPQLFHSGMSLIHVILDHNKLTGGIPPSLGFVQTLEVVRVDGNSLGGSIPSNLNNLTSLNELFLSNNALTGDIPNLNGMSELNYVDMSNNSFDPSAFPTWLTGIQSLTTLIMENTNLEEEIPVSFFGLPQLESVILRNNHINGTLDIGNSYSSSMHLDLQNNSISVFKQNTANNLQLSLNNNPICQGNSVAKEYCGSMQINNSSPLSNNCSQISCRSDQVLSPLCKCAYPYAGTLHFFSYSFSNLENSTYYRSLAGSLIASFRSNGVPVESVNLSSPSIDVYSYLQFRLQVFPSGVENFNRTSISSIGFLLNRQPFNLSYFGPFFYVDESYCCFAGEKKASKTGIIVGAILGSILGLALILLFCGFIAYRRKGTSGHTTNIDPFANWDASEGNGGVPQLKGAKSFSFEELKKCAEGFSESNCIGSGGYGKVYKGKLASGQVVAIKRAQQGSMQGALEFKTEIELLSRIHHKNVVSLVGFCYDQGEQMLVYEFISNGTLTENISGKSGIQLDWMRRLRIALDAARGLAYLHELTDPPIIHRDIKSNNILLDDNLNAKVADFGLSKLLGDASKGYVSTQVKGTLGYMDPEYYMTQQLTEKSDVYSFGIVLLELITARAPIERGRHIVRVIQEAIKDSKDGSGYYDDILDPKISAGGGNHDGLNKLVDLAMKCVKEYGGDRPSMGEVVREIENIMQLAGLKKKGLTENTYSFSSEDKGDASHQQSYGSQDFEYSVGSLPFNIDRR